VQPSTTGKEQELEKTEQFMLARQPICVADKRIFGYELLFRDCPTATEAKIVDSERASAQIVVNTIEMGLSKIIGPTQAFINVGREFILQHRCEFVPKNRVVLEILENTEPDAEVKSALREQVREGYRFALDDFTFDRNKPFLEFCNFLKIDLRQVDEKTLRELLPAYRNRKMALIAEKVETYEEFEMCKKLGFDYFQGFFLCKPQTLSGKRIPASKMFVYRLMSKLQDPEISLRELERIVAQDISLSYKLLRYINSAYISLLRKIDSVGHAVRLVGIDHIRNLASLIMLAGMDDKPRELSMISLIRAKMCEILAGNLGLKDHDAHFTVGLFSTLDAYLDCPMDQAIDPLPLNDDIRHALTKQGGLLGETLRMVLSYEQARWDKLDNRKVDARTLREAYVNAVEWGRGLVNGLATTR
jgi:EAL and modified HD-GYP domain-containing signal transduction protein